MKFTYKKRGALLAIVMLAAISLSACNNSDRVDANLKNITTSGKIVAVDGTLHDLGLINIKGGKTKHTFKLKNEGNEPLILKRASTSCMCTKARYRLPDDSISPMYGMRGNPDFWAAEIKPGETFDVEAIYDPMAHGPDAVGTIRRSIFLETSAKNNPKLELVVAGDVLYEEDYREKMKEKQANMPL